MGDFLRVTSVVARKELTELFRDVRSMVITVVVPIVLFPALFVLFNTNLEQQRAIGRNNQTVGVAPGLLRQWTTNEVVPAPLLQYTLVSSERGNVAAGTVVAELTADDRLLYNDRSEISTAAAVEIATGLNAERNARAAPDAAQAQIRMETIASTGGTPGALLALAAVVPLFLLLAASVSPLPAALDLGAGEKQRQSLEFLLAATPHRGGIFFGKALAVAVTGVLGVVGFVGGIVLAHKLVPELLSLDASDAALSAHLLLTGATIALLLVMTISVLELLLSIAARTPREAQGYFLPFLVMISGIGYTVLLTDIWYVPNWMLYTPLLNIAVLSKNAYSRCEHNQRGVVGFFGKRWYNSGGQSPWGHRSPQRVGATEKLTQQQKGEP